MRSVGAAPPPRAPTQGRRLVAEVGHRPPPRPPLACDRRPHARGAVSRTGSAGAPFIIRAGVSSFKEKSDPVT